MAFFILVIITARFAIVGAERIYFDHPDWLYFHRAGDWLLERGTFDQGYDIVDGRTIERGKLDWYWPFVPRLMTLFAASPFGGYFWLALNLVSMLITIRLVGRYLSGLPPKDWPVTQLLPLLFLVAYWQWEFRLNQINNLTLYLLVGSIVCWQWRRSTAAGLWLGLAVLLKLTPGLLVLWFLLKRQYRVVGAAVLTVIVAGPVSDVLVFGPDRTAEAYRAWARKSIDIGSHRGLILHDREMDWRNQSLSAVLTRWLTPTNYNTHFDNDPNIQRDYDHLPVRTMNVADLSRPTVVAIVMGIVFVSLAGLVWLARKPASELTAWQIRFEWALFVLAMLWFMPVMRRYHMVWALPAVSLLGAGIHYMGFRAAWSRFALVCIALAVMVQFTMLYRPLEAGGTILFSVLVLMLPLVAMLVRLGRDPTSLTPPYFVKGTRRADMGNTAPAAAGAAGAAGDHG